MKCNYWVSHFAERRLDQLIKIPNDYKIHSDFFCLANENEIRYTFSQLYMLYLQIFEDIKELPEEFGMPLYSKDEYRNFSQQCRESEQATFRPFILLYNLFINGEIEGQSVIVSIDKFKSIKPQPTHTRTYSEKTVNSNSLFNKLQDYGFVFEGLKNNKTTKEDIVISYPDNTLLLYLWKTLADKAKNINCVLDFLLCSFRLLQDDIHTKSYNSLTSFMDTFPTTEEKEFITKMDQVLLSMGMVRGEIGYYYRNENLLKQKNPCSFRIININTWDPWSSEIKPNKLEVGLRIRNVYNCMEYLQSCPNSVRKIFTEKNDSGCRKHNDNTCKHGVSYEMDRQSYWRCACCNPAFRFMQPRIEDIPYYIKLVELGEKKF